MHITLKERVNPKRTKLTFIFAVFLSFWISKTSAQENQQPFDYTKTVWIINVMEGSGTVYGRPRPEDYNPRQGLIYIYEILIKYVYNLQDLNTVSQSNSLTVTHELILINGVAEQRLLIGDHWISDERNIAIMSEADYNNLKEWLGTKETNKDYKENPPIDKLISVFKGYTSANIESFEKHFNSNQTSSVTTKIQTSTANTQTSIDAKADEKSSHIAEQNKSSAKSESKSSISGIGVGIQFGREEFSKSSVKPDSVSPENLKKSEDDNTNFYFWLNIIIGFLLAACALRLWKGKR
jgi:hypothetical protein